MCNVSRIALNTINLSLETRYGRGTIPGECSYSIIQYLNYEGRGNSISWFKQLDLMQQKAAVLERVQTLLGIWQQSFVCFNEHFGKGQAFSDRLYRHRYALQGMLVKAPKLIETALCDVAVLLQPIQQGISRNAEKELGQYAVLPYQLKKMVSNPDYLPNPTATDIECAFEKYVSFPDIPTIGV